MKYKINSAELCWMGLLGCGIPGFSNARYCSLSIQEIIIVFCAESTTIVSPFNPKNAKKIYSMPVLDSEGVSTRNYTNSIFNGLVAGLSAVYFHFQYVLQNMDRTIPLIAWPLDVTVCLASLWIFQLSKPNAAPTIVVPQHPWVATKKWTRLKLEWL